MRIQLHPHARAELRDARNWYFERSPISAFAFAQTVENALSIIKEAPNTFSLADHGTRKFVLQRFDPAGSGVLVCCSGGKPLFLTCSILSCANRLMETRIKNRTSQEEGLAPAG